MTEQQIPAAELRDGDVVVDKAGTRWPVSGVTEARGLLEFWIGNPPLHRVSKVPTETVTVERPDAPPEWAIEPTPAATFDVVKAAETGNGWGTTAESDPVALVEEKLGGEVLAEESKAHEHARNAATVTGQPMTLPEFPDFTILEKRSHLFLVHGIYAHDVKDETRLREMHLEAHNAAEKPGRWVAHEHVAGAPFPTEVPGAGDEE